MPFDFVANQPVIIAIRYEHSITSEVTTNSPLIDHFLQKVKLSQSVHTWLNYAHDLKIFFTIVALPLEQIDRQSCVRFMEHQTRSGLSSLTINRRLAAISSLFTELHLLDPDAFPRNPVTPLRRDRQQYKPGQSLYRRQPDRIPDIIAEKDLQAFFEVLPSLSGSNVNSFNVDELFEDQ